MYYISLTLIFLFYTFITLVINYYISLFKSKDLFTKEELKNVKPYFFEKWSELKKIYSPFSFLTSFFIFSLIGIMFPKISENKVINSIIPFAFLYYLLPFLEKIVQKQVLPNEKGIQKTAKDFFLKNYPVFIFAFGLGSFTSISINWMINPTIYSFLLFSANFLGTIILLQYSFNFVMNKYKK